MTLGHGSFRRHVAACAEWFSVWIKIATPEHPPRQLRTRSKGFPASPCLQAVTVSSCDTHFIICFSGSIPDFNLNYRAHYPVYAHVTISLRKILVLQVRIRTLRDVLSRCWCHRRAGGLVSVPFPLWNGSFRTLYRSRRQQTQEIAVTSASRAIIIPPLCPLIYPVTLLGFGIQWTSLLYCSIEFE